VQLIVELVAHRIGQGRQVDAAARLPLWRRRRPREELDEAFLAAVGDGAQGAVELREVADAVSDMVIVYSASCSLSDMAMVDSASEVVVVSMALIMKDRGRTVIDICGARVVYVRNHARMTRASRHEKTHRARGVGLHLGRLAYVHGSLYEVILRCCRATCVRNQLS
jgi:hypothetical protein